MKRFFIETNLTELGLEMLIAVLVLHQRKLERNVKLTCSSAGYFKSFL